MRGTRKNMANGDERLWHITEEKERHNELTRRDKWSDHGPKTIDCGNAKRRNDFQNLSEIPMEGSMKETKQRL